MATRREFLKVVESHGATVDEESEMAFIVDAPRGKVWVSTGNHGLTHQFKNFGGQSWKPEAYDDAIQDMKMGLMDCDEQDCEVCNEEI